MHYLEKPDWETFDNAVALRQTGPINAGHAHRS